MAHSERGDCACAWAHLEAAEAWFGAAQQEGADVQGWLDRAAELKQFLLGVAGPQTGQAAEGGDMDAGDDGGEAGGQEEATSGHSFTLALRPGKIPAMQTAV